MSYADTIRGQKVALQLSNGATPTPVFTTVCGITTKGLQRTRQTNDSVNWDCADPDAPPITEKDMANGDWTLSGSGLVSVEHLEEVEDAYDAPNDWRLVFFGTGTTVIRSYTGPAIMTDLNIGAANGEKATISLTLSGAGELVRSIPGG